MLGTPRAPRTGMEGEDRPRAGDTGAEMVLVARQGNMADSREVMNIRQASKYLGVSPDTLQVRGRAKDSRLQAGQPLALQEVEAGSVEGREVEPDGSGYETQTEGSDK